MAQPIGQMNIVLSANAATFTSGALDDFNKTLVDIMTTSRNQGGPHFVAHQFESLGKGVFTKVSSAALQKGEGALFGGMMMKPKGTAADPIQTKSVDGPVAGSITGPLSFLNTGLNLPNVMAAPSASAAKGGFWSSLVGMLPAFAEGTSPLSAGTMALVGERGPEIAYLPKGAGVIPNKSVSNMGGHTLHVNVDARGATDPAQVEAAANRAVMRAAPHLVAASMQGVNERKMRSPLSKR